MFEKQRLKFLKERGNECCMKCHHSDGCEIAEELDRDGSGKTKRGFNNLNRIVVEIKYYQTMTSSYQL